MKDQVCCWRHGVFEAAVPSIENKAAGYPHFDNTARVTGGFSHSYKRQKQTGEIEAQRVNIERMEMERWVHHVTQAAGLLLPRRALRDLTRWT